MYIVVDEKCKNYTPNRKYLESNKESSFKNGFRAEKAVKVKGRKKQKALKSSN
jgi:hypothetical protein